MNCPKCGSEVWDNRPKKQSGAFKATSPDFSCKNKACDWREWPDKTAAAPAPRKAASPPVPRAGAWDEVHALYGRALNEARKISDVLEDQATIAAALAIVAAVKGLSGVDAPVPATPPPATGPAFDGAPPPDTPPDDEPDLPF